MNRNDDHLQGGEDNSRADAVLAGGHLQAPEQVPGRQSQVSASSSPLAGPGRQFGIQDVKNRSEQDVNSEPGRQSGRQQQRRWVGRLSAG